MTYGDGKYHQKVGFHQKSGKGEVFVTAEERIKSLAKMVGIAECLSNDDKSYIEGFLIGYANAMAREKEKNKVA